MHTFVKVCGITEAAVLAEIPEGGAAGFVVEVPGCVRSLSVEAVAPLVEALPPGAEAWAVVADPSAELVHRLFGEAGVDRIQVYGKVPPDLEFLEVHHLVPSLPLPPRGVPDRTRRSRRPRTIRGSTSMPPARRCPAEAPSSPTGRSPTGSSRPSPGAS